METASVRHQDKYKCRTPPWKDTYRKRCLDRLRDSRSKLQNRLRNVENVADVSLSEKSLFVKEVMTEELKCLKNEKTSSRNLQFDIESSIVDDVDEMLSLFDDIQKELLQEEERLIAEYEEHQRGLEKEEIALSKAITALSTDEVVCPLCQRNPLLLNKGIIFCPCGLRINTEQDCISLCNVKQQLDEGVSLHSSDCDRAPQFSVVDSLGITNLLITCQVCDFMFVVV